MGTEISEEDLKRLEQYISDLKKGDYTELQKLNRVDPEELKEVFPIITALLTYGHKTRGLASDQNNKPNYLDLLEAQKRDMVYPRLIASQTPRLLNDLIAQYRKVLAAKNETILAQKRDQLFQKKIIDMTGYEFEDYLRQMRLIK